ncbi:conserved hypothetical protein [Leishmania major strain Friedlin]|uniref:Uncharacterized protein n=1 Tax=Leishmania major TaxID=5664 RepID=Q4Q585_LEIMA|nr:conserved hypothetical protein [Leishmania major strain Friedlin]CAG9580323.1 hypothetical_protein_-_conserved [Leishmania major strain Friedlin]CAJ08717.1 conserved hypothetical protein [Leishmania major strain Friedlin]|eukprot:XP_001685513.1 conserved hypothetical protein [Leishmania major strain Friedlin]
MTTAVEAIDVDDDERYSDDSFQDDFESDSSSTSHRSAHMKEASSHDERAASEDSAVIGEGTPSNATASTSSSGNSPSPDSSHNSSVLHSLGRPPVHLEGAAKGASTAASSDSSLSSLPLPRRSSDSASAHSANYASTSEEARLAEKSTAYDDDSSLLPADRVYEGQQRLADGRMSESCSRSGRVSIDQRSTGGACARDAGYPVGSQPDYVSTNASVTGRCRLQRPGVPGTAEELVTMQEENASMREELFQRSREHYHASFSQSSKSGGTFNGNRTIGGPGASHKSTLTSTIDNTFRRHRESTARFVQVSLTAHRTLQVLRLEQRELLRRRDQLKELVSRYKKATKYKDYIEIAKQDIAVLTEDHRDAHLEVRCNEKLLLMNDAMFGSGLGDRRLLEEVRSQNALTQRRREHALRDADSAQRVRDAAAKRVEELKWELKKRHQWMAEENHADVNRLRLFNQAKKDRIHELRRQLRQLRQEGRETRGGSGSCPRKSHGPPQVCQRHQCYTRPDDAEREYLERRIAEIHRRLEAIAGAPSQVAASRRTSIGDAASPARDTGSAAASPKPEASQNELPAAAQQEGTSAATVVQEPVRACSVDVESAEAGSNNAYGEVDVTAWLNAHSATVSAHNEATYSQRSSHNAATAGNDCSEETGAPAVPQAEVWHQERTGATATADAEPPLWLDAGEDGGDLDIAPTQADLAPLPSYEHDAADSVEEDIAEDELGSDAEQAAPAAAASAHGDVELDDLLFGAGGHAPAYAAASPSAPAADNNDDGPDWLNF